MGNESSTPSRGGGMGSRATSSNGGTSSEEWVIPMGAGATTSIQSASVRAAQRALKRAPAPALRGNPRVFLDFSVRDSGRVSFIGRVEIVLRADIAPKTCENFRQLCLGVPSSKDGETLLHYKKSVLHRIIPGFMIQGGDITRGDGTGGESIYGAKFNDENYTLKHDKPFVLSMANAGGGQTNGTNSSQFFITTVVCSWLDGKHTVFSSPIEPQYHEIIKILESYGTRTGKPTAEVFISDCGEVSLAPPPASGAAPAAAAAASSASVPVPLQSNNVRCFVEFADEVNTVVGRVEFELFSAECPRTAENFRALCTGEHGGILNYKGTAVHRLFKPHFCIQFGDNEGKKGLGGRSIYNSGRGGAFDDEPAALRFPHKAGSLAMATARPNANKSMVYVLMVDAPHLDGQTSGAPGSDAVFGRVVAGMGVLRTMEEFGTPTGVPKRKFHVSDSGEISTIAQQQKQHQPVLPVSDAAADAINSMFGMMRSNSSSDYHNPKEVEKDASDAFPPDAIIQPPFIKAFDGGVVPEPLKPFLSDFLKSIECCVCLSTFDAASRMPTTLACGHSVCLSHVELLEHCPQCRQRIDRRQRPEPNYVLRDILAVFAPTDGASIADAKKQRPRAATPPGRRAYQHQRYPGVRASCVSVEEGFPGLLGGDESDGGDDDDTTYRRRPVSPPPVERSRRWRLRQQRAASSTAAATAAAAAHAVPATKPSGHQGHVCPFECSIARTQGRCCGCMDRRPMQAQGTYERYVDGRGYQPIGTRHQSYCPTCHDVAERNMRL